MPLGVVPDVKTAPSISVLIYQYVSTHTCVPNTHALPHLLYTWVVEQMGLPCYLGCFAYYHHVEIF